MKAKTTARKASSSTTKSGTAGRTASSAGKPAKPVAAAKSKRGVAAKSVARKAVAKTGAAPKAKVAPAKKATAKAATAVKARPAATKVATKKVAVKAAAVVKKAAVPASTKTVKAPAPKPAPQRVAQTKPAVASAASKPVRAQARAITNSPSAPVLPPTLQGSKATFTPPSMSVTLSQAPVAQTIKKNPKLANNWKNKPVDTLTDEEVVAMPDDEYMNNTQLAFFRLKLQQLKSDILSSAGETTEHLREDTVVVPDPADRATIEEEHALELRTRDRERKLLKKIEQSIQRIDAGDYGYCDETGEPIGVGRLIARPTASLSLEAQQRRELKQKMFGD